MLLLELAEKAKQPIEYGQGMGRATGNVEVDGQEGPCAAVRLGVSDEGAAGDRATPHGDGYLGSGHGIPGLPESQFHVPGHRARDEYAVGMPGRGDDLYAEPAQVPAYGPEDVHVGLACVAASGAHDTQFQGSPEQPLHVLPERVGETERAFVPCDYHVLAVPEREAVISGTGNGAMRTGVYAIRAEEAFPEVQPIPARRIHGAGRASVDADAASRRAFFLENHRSAPEPVRHGGRGACGIPDRPVSLPQARPDGFMHGSVPPYRSCPQ